MVYQRKVPRPASHLGMQLYKKRLEWDIAAQNGTMDQALDELVDGLVDPAGIKPDSMNLEEAALKMELLRYFAKERRLNKCEHPRQYRHSKLVPAMAALKKYITNTMKALAL